MFRSYCVAALLLAASFGLANAGYLDENPDEVFESVYARIGVLPVQAARDPFVWLRLQELKREPCDQKSINDLALMLDKLGYRRQAAEGLDHLGQVAVRGADDADVDLKGIIVANAANFAALQDAQQLGLHRLGQFADLVEKNRAAVGHLE